MSAIKAIETHYAGHRFRSRLEARWAVFFDALGIEWVYEDQGYLVSTRLSSLGYHEDHFPYLPDFWLPGHGVFAEVKGALSVDECIRLLDAAASISSQDAGGCGDGPNTVVLGPIPSEKRPRLPLSLHMHKGDLQAAAWSAQPGGGCHSATLGTLATDYGGGTDIFSSSLLNEAWPRSGDCDLLARRTCTYLLQGDDSPVSTRVMNAYAKARKARFEHGERG